MYLLGYSLDNLSLMALTLAVGLRGGRRHRGAGEHRPAHREGRAGAGRRRINGSREITFTVISMTLSLVAVFIPVLFLGGLIGRLFQDFAVTIGVAILVSGFVSLTLTPMLCSRWLKPHEPERAARPLLPAIERVWEASLAWYERTLALGHGPPAAGDGVQRADPGGHHRPRPHRAQGLHPERGPEPALRRPRRPPRAPATTPWCKHQRAAAAIVQEDPNVDGFMSSVGGGGRTSTINQGRLIMHLKDRDRAGHERRRGGPIAHRRSWRPCPGCGCSSRIRRSINIGGRSSKSEYQFTLHELRHRRAVPGCGRPGAAAPRGTRAHRRDQRSADQEPRGPGCDRPRPGGRARDRRESDRERALQRVRRPPGQHHLHAQRPVLGGHGAAAAVPARPLGA